MALNTAPVIGSKYALITKLGHGSMADVYLGLAEGIQGFAKLAVVKLLRSHLAQDADFVARFLEEGRIAMRLSHPNVVQTYEVGQDGATYYLAMEFLQGQTLSSVLNRMTRESEDFDYACQIVVLTEVLTALEYAHELADYDGTLLKVIHRDVSPPNIFITYDGSVKVLDFGIAKALDTCVETKTGLILGKAAYMPPEQALGRELDRRADLYAVGVMLWEAIAGRRRWEGMQDAAIIRELVTSELVELPSRLPPGCSPRVQDVLSRALAPDPADRYASAAEFRSDLELVLAESGAYISARQLGPRVATAFRSENERLQRELELQIARRDPSARLALRRNVAELEQGSNLPKLQPVQERSGRHSVDPVTTGARRTTHASDTRSHTLLAAGAIALAVVAAWSAGWLASNRSATAQQPAAAPVPSVEKVSLRLAAHPPSAVLYLDDDRLSGNPAVVERPADGSVHVFRAEAPEHEPALRVVKVAGHVDVTLRLEPQRASPAQAPETGAPTARSATSHTRRSSPVTRSAKPSLPVGKASFPATATAAPSSAPVGPDAVEPKVDLDLENPW